MASRYFSISNSWEVNFNHLVTWSVTHLLLSSSIIRSSFSKVAGVGKFSDFS